MCPDVDGAAPSHAGGAGTEFSAAVAAIAAPNIAAEPALAPWRSALQPPADLRRLLAPRSAWAILGLASGEPAFAARVARGLDAPEASRARARLKQEELIALLPLLSARAGRAWCSVADPAALGRLFDDQRLLASPAADQLAPLQAYVRASDLPALVDAYGLHAAPSHLPRTVLLRPVPEPWPFADGATAVPRLVHALDLLELAADGRILDTPPVDAAWELIEQHAAQDVRSWYRAARPPRAGVEATGLRLDAALRPPRARSAVSYAVDADTLSALLFVVGTPLQPAELLVATGWTPSRLQAATDALVAEPPRGMRVLHADDGLVLGTSGAATDAVERLLAARRRRERLEPLRLTDSVWLVLGIVALDQPITRAEISARRMADSDRQVQQLLHDRLLREEPRAALPGRGIPVVTTDLLLRRLGVGSLGELQQQLLSQQAEPAAAPS